MYVDNTEIKYRSQLSRRQVEVKIKELTASAKRIGQKTWKLPTLNMLVMLKDGVSIEDFIRRYIEDRNSIREVEKRAKRRLSKKKDIEAYEKLQSLLSGSENIEA